MTASEGNHSKRPAIARFVRRGIAPWRRGPAIVLTGRLLAAAATASGLAAAVSYREIGLTWERIRQSDSQERRRVERLSSVAGFQTSRGDVEAIVAGAVEKLLEGEERSRARGLQAAQRILSASEKYPRVDPVLLASVAIVDARQHSASSSGIELRHRPSEKVARRYAELLGWEWAEEDDLLEDPARSAEVAARHLGELQRHYNDLEMVLAEYNGGPLNAGYLRAGVSRLSAATKSYIPQVIDVYRNLTTSLAATKRHPGDSHSRRWAHHGSAPEPGSSARAGAELPSGPDSSRGLSSSKMETAQSIPQAENNNQERSLK